MKKNTMIPLIVFLVLATLIFFSPALKQMTGFAVLNPSDLPSGYGCCSLYCNETLSSSCPSVYFSLGKACSEDENCNIGCCIDDEGYCLGNYVKAKCEAQHYSFQKVECSEISACLERGVDYRGDTGNRRTENFTAYFDEQIIQPEDDLNIIRLGKVKPSVGKKGTVFTIEYRSVPDYDVQEIEARLFDKDNGPVDRLILSSQGDGVYTALWDSSLYDKKLDTITVDIILLLKNSTMIQHKDAALFTFYDTDCEPLDIIDFSKRNIVFISKDWNSEKDKIYLVADEIKDIDPLKGNVNTFFVQQDFSDLATVPPILTFSSSCHLPSQDNLVMMLDEANPICEKKPEFYITNPDIFAFTARSYTIDDVFADPCIIFDTVEGNSERVKEKAPYGKILVPGDSTPLYFYTNKVYFDLNITDDIDTNLNYDIYLNNNFYSGTIQNNIITSRDIVNVPDGIHDIILEVKDSDGYEYIADNFTIVVDSSVGFYFDSQNIENCDTTDCKVKFKIVHPSAANIGYDVLIDETIKKSSTTASNTEVEESLGDLTDGFHLIYINATDDSTPKKTIKSKIIVKP